VCGIYAVGNEKKWSTFLCATLYLYMYIMHVPPNNLIILAHAERSPRSSCQVTEQKNWLHSVTTLVIFQDCLNTTVANLSLLWIL